MHNQVVFDKTWCRAEVAASSELADRSKAQKLVQGVYSNFAPPFVGYAGGTHCAKFENTPWRISVLCYGQLIPDLSADFCSTM